MRRLQFVAQLGVSILIAPPAYPQSVEPSIGFMSTRSANDSTRVVAAFVKGLQETGFDEGRNVSIEYRFAEGALDRLPEIANDLVRSRVKVIVAAGGANSALAAKAVSATTSSGVSALTTRTRLTFRRLSSRRSSSHGESGSRTSRSTIGDGTKFRTPLMNDN